MVAHPGDRNPPSAPTSSSKKILSYYSQVVSLCHLVDAAGNDAFPRGFTYHSLGNKLYSSRIDRIYFPSGYWNSGDPVAIPTLWSDHKLVWADCKILDPRVQIAIAAPRLPNVEVLDKSETFWSAALKSYSMLTSAHVTLESWSLFKKTILKSGVETAKKIKSDRNSKWASALRGELIPMEDLPAAVEASRVYSPNVLPPAPSCRWRPAILYNPPPPQSTRSSQAPLGIRP